MLQPLPIDDHLEKIRNAVDRVGRAVVVAPPGSGKTTRVPPALLDAPVTAACLQVLPGDLDHEEMMFNAGDVTWIERRGGKITKRKFEGGIAEDACNISEIGFRKRGKSLQILVAGDGRNCDGGTASTGFRLIHSIEADGLKEVEAHYVSYH